MTEEEYFEQYGEDLSDIMPMSDIAAYLDVSEKQLHTWAGRSEKNGFPAAEETFGDKYKLYSLKAVTRWVVLWQKVNKNLGNKELNRGTRTNG